MPRDAIRPGRRARAPLPRTARDRGRSPRCAWRRTPRQPARQTTNRQSLPLERAEATRHSRQAGTESSRKPTFHRVEQGRHGWFGRHPRPAATSPDEGRVGGFEALEACEHAGEPVTQARTAHRSPGSFRSWSPRGHPIVRSTRSAATASMLSAAAISSCSQRLGWLRGSPPSELGRQRSSVRTPRSPSGWMSFGSEAGTRSPPIGCGNSRHAQRDRHSEVLERSTSVTMSSASSAVRASAVGWSAMRISSVPKRGCGRTSHQMRV